MKFCFWDFQIFLCLYKCRFCFPVFKLFFFIGRAGIGPGICKTFFDAQVFQSNIHFLWCTLEVCNGSCQIRTGHKGKLRLSFYIIARIYVYNFYLSRSKGGYIYKFICIRYNFSHCFYIKRGIGVFYFLCLQSYFFFNVFIYGDSPCRSMVMAFVAFLSRIVFICAAFFCMIVFSLTVFMVMSAVVSCCYTSCCGK